MEEDLPEYDVASQQKTFITNPQVAWTRYASSGRLVPQNRTAFC